MSLSFALKIIIIILFIFKEEKEKEAFNQPSLVYAVEEWELASIAMESSITRLVQFVHVLFDFFTKYQFCTYSICATQVTQISLC
jgi:hypothetical protein